MTIDEIQSQKDITLEVTEKLKDVVDYNNIEAGEEAMRKKDLLLEAKEKEIAMIKNKYYKLHGEYTDVKQQLNAMTESKNRYQKEFMKANKTIVESKETRTPSDSFVDDLTSRIRSIKKNSWQK
jgi:chromosome segregation ATPase